MGKVAGVNRLVHAACDPQLGLAFSISHCKACYACDRMSALGEISLRPTKQVHYCGALASSVAMDATDLASRYQVLEELGSKSPSLDSMPERTDRL